MCQFNIACFVHISPAVCKPAMISMWIHNDFYYHVKQEKSETRQWRRDPALPAWPRQKKHWLMQSGVGVVSQRQCLWIQTSSLTLMLSHLIKCVLHCSDSSYSLLADDVLGSYLLCPHPKKHNCGSLVIRFPSGLVTHLVESTRKGKFLLEVIVLLEQYMTVSL